jgi:putative transcriptional regulator
MTIRHHPSDETLLRLSAGTLSAGVNLVIASHIEGCTHCRGRVAAFEAAGGQLICDLVPTSLSDDLFARTLQRIDADQDRRAAIKKAILASPRRPDGIVLPRALDTCDASPWRWIAPGIHLSRVMVPNAPDANVILLKVAPNKVMPEHGHAGTEYTQVLTGTLIDGSVTLRPGDLMEADNDIEHQPVAGPDCVCISLAAVEGKLSIDNFIGRMVLSMVGL